MSADESLRRLQNLQRDLLAFSESRLPNVDRLSAELQASIEELKRLLEKKKKNETSRKELAPTTTPTPETIKIHDVQYIINDDFRRAALLVADELDLDELEAAKLCIDAAPFAATQDDNSLPFRALLHFHQYRGAVLECLRLLLQQSLESESEDEIAKVVLDAVVSICGGRATEQSAYWRKCVDGLAEIETSLKKVGEHRQTVIMTGQSQRGDLAEALDAQRVLLTRQHESMAVIMTYLIRGNHVQLEDYRALLSKMASLESSIDISIHYLPILTSGSAFFGSNEHTTPDASHSMHKLFAAGPGQLQWKQTLLKGAATICWLAEYSSRFADTLSDPSFRVADREQAAQERHKLCIDAVNNKALHVLLATCHFLRPEVRHDPAKVGLVKFLLGGLPNITSDAPPPSDHFAAATMNELQAFTDAFVTNLPDAIRTLKQDADDDRRQFYSRRSEEDKYQPHLERFIVVMAYAYQDADAAQDFWTDKESNLYGFLRWVSQRLTTPRVAAFCELLRSIACDTNSANQAHRFLLEDTIIVSGKSRKTYSVSWLLIFAELETYASSLRDRPAPPPSNPPDGVADPIDIYESETYIMLEAYLRLAAHICQQSPDARNWLLREQPTNLADIMLQLASSGTGTPIKASCFNLLAALLVDKVPEVNDGMWVLLETWNSGGGAAASNNARPPATLGAANRGQQYLQSLNQSPETAAAFVALLNALIVPSASQAGVTLDALPFPEGLGGSRGHAGIDRYVDFVMGTAFRLSTQHIQSADDFSVVNVLRHACLEFAFICLSTFNEDLVLLANTTSLAVDAAMKASSLSTYARLHPFARVMEWLFNNGVIEVLFASAQQDVDTLNGLDPDSPPVRVVLKAVEVINLAMKLQATYFDIVRPIIKTGPLSRSSLVANPAFASFDEVLLSQLGIVTDVVSYAASTHVALSLEALRLLDTLTSSRKVLQGSGSAPSGSRAANPLISALAGVSDAIAVELIPDFSIYEFDLELGEEPVKLSKAQATLNMLNSSLDVSPTQPTVAHCLLGFECRERSIAIAPEGAFLYGKSLFHAITACAAQAPVVISPSNVSWLLSVRRGCLDIVQKLALSPMTADLVRRELRTMDFLAATSKSQLPVSDNLLWDGLASTDPDALLSTSAASVRDFMHTRALFFEYAALELRSVIDGQLYSVRERVISTLLGVIYMTPTEQEPTLSLFDLVDFFALATSAPSIVSHRHFLGIDLSICTKLDAEIGHAYDLKIAEEYLILRKRELVTGGAIRDGNEEQQVDDEIRATLASLLSHNSWRSIQNARLSALGAWTELISFLIASGDLEAADVQVLALRGLTLVVPMLETSLSDSLDSATVLARLTLTLVTAASPITGTPSQSANAVHERLISAFRVCLKAMSDSSTGLALRDICYRICCAIIQIVPLKALSGKAGPSQQAKQLLHLIQMAGDRTLRVVTEDAFSGRGSTRVSAVLFLDALVSLFQSGRATAAILKSLTKLNFVPVLIDTSIGSVATSFTDDADELAIVVAHFHTALALLLRICRTGDGTQLVLNAGFFAAVNDSRLFSTDPDIGLDIDNPVALKEFYKLLCAVLRVITAIVISCGSANAATLQQAKLFLQQNRFSIMAVFKRTSAVHKTAGPPEQEALDVADEFGKLMLFTGFLEVGIQVPLLTNVHADYWTGR